MNVFEQMRAERMAWREKFNAATPAEQERMLAEKAARRAEEEKMREQRIYDDYKSRFVERCKKQIDVYKTLLSYRAMAMEVIKSFDGKVLNNRLTNVVEVKMKKSYQYSWATLNFENDYSTKEVVGKLKLDANNRDCDDSDTTIRIYMFNGRVDWSRTESEDKTEKWLTNEIAKLQNAIKTYDKGYKSLKKVEKAIAEYAKENYYVRDWLTRNHILTNKGYL